MGKKEAQEMNRLAKGIATHTRNFTKLNSGGHKEDADKERETLLELVEGVTKLLEKWIREAKSAPGA